MQQAYGHGQALLMPPASWPAGCVQMLARRRTGVHRINAVTQARAMQAAGAAEKLRFSAADRLPYSAKASARRSRCADRACARAVRRSDAGHARLPAAGRQQAAQHAEGGGLAGAVGAQQAEDFSARAR